MIQTLELFPITILPIVKLPQYVLTERVIQCVWHKEKCIIFIPLNSSINQIPKSINVHFYYSYWHEFIQSHFIYSCVDKNWKRQSKLMTYPYKVYVVHQEHVLFVCTKPYNTFLWIFPCMNHNVFFSILFFSMCPIDSQRIYSLILFFFIDIARKWKAIIFSRKR